MTDGKFLHSLRDAYRQILFEQDVPAGPVPAAAPAPGTPPPTPPAPGAPPPVVPPMPGAPGEATTDVEKPKPDQTALTPESEAMLAGLLAKAFFIDLLDETEKYKVKNMQGNISDDTAPQIELEVVKRIKAEDPKILDIEEDLFELSPAGARMFLNKIANGKTIEGLEIKPGGGQAYLLNLILTVMLRHFELGEKVKVQEILEDIRDKTTKGPTLDESKTAALFEVTFNKYAKV